MTPNGRTLASLETARSDDCGSDDGDGGDGSGDGGSGESDGGDEGDGGDESDEGDSGDEGDESDESDDGDEGDESDEDVPEDVPQDVAPGQNSIVDDARTAHRMVPPDPRLLRLLLRLLLPSPALLDVLHTQSYVAGFRDGRSVRRRHEGMGGGDDDDGGGDDGNPSVEWCLRRVAVRRYAMDNHEEACAICQDPLCHGDLVPVLPCTHHFHARCFRTWVARQRLGVRCPLCRCPVWGEVAVDSLFHAVRGQNDGPFI